jgi:3-hydroxybutyrate dehydrogenase
MFDEAAGDEWVEPEDVANAMLDLVENDECSAGKITGGTILEVGKNQTRIVAAMNDPGPSGPGHSVRNEPQIIEEIFNSAAAGGWGK